MLLPVASASGLAVPAVTIAVALVLLRHLFRVEERISADERGLTAEQAPPSDRPARGQGRR